MPISREEPRQRDKKGRFISDEAMDDLKKRDEARDKATSDAAAQLHKDFTDSIKSVKGSLDDLGDRSQKIQSLNRKLIKDNAEFFTSKAEKFMDQGSNLESTAALSDMSDLLKEQVGKMVDISQEAATADFATLKKLKNESLASLKSLEVLATTDESPQMAELIKVNQQQFKMLSQETNLLSSMGEGISSIAKTGLGALAGIASGNPLIAMGIQGIQSGLEKRADNKEKVVMAQIETAKKQQEKLLQDAVDVKDSEAADPEEILNKTMSAIESMAAELVPDDATDEEAQAMMAEVAAKLETLVGITDDERDMFSTWMSGSEEERREALDREKDKLQVFNRMADALEDLKDDKEEDDLGLLDIAGGNVIADAFTGMLKQLKAGAVLLVGGIFGFLKSAVKTVGKFLIKTLPKFIGRFFAPIAIIGALFSGMSDAIDEYAKSGNIGEAVIAGLAGILDFITFGLVNEEMGKKIFHSIAAWFSGVKDTIVGAFPALAEGFMAIVNKAWDAVIGGATIMWNEFVADFMNVSDWLADTAFGQAIRDAIAPVIDTFIAGWDTVAGFATDMWASVTDKWESVKNGITDIFDWFADIFTVETFKRLIPESLANMIFDDDVPLNEQNGVDLAIDNDLIDRNNLIPGQDSEILEPGKLKHFTAKQLRDLIDLDDWSNKDEKMLRSLWRKALEDESPNVVNLDARRAAKVAAAADSEAEIVKGEPEQVVEEVTEEKNEMVVGDSQAQKINLANQAAQKSEQEKEERQQANQRQMDSQSKTFVQTNNNNSSSVQNISNEKTYDTDLVASRSENLDRVG